MAGMDAGGPAGWKPACGRPEASGPADGDVGAPTAGSRIFFKLAKGRWPPQNTVPVFLWRSHLISINLNFQ